MKPLTDQQVLDLMKRAEFPDTAMEQNTAHVWDEQKQSRVQSPSYWIANLVELVRKGRGR